MDVQVGQCRYLLKLADRVLAGLDDSHSALEPRPGTKTAGWLVGHLAVSGDFARCLYGRSAMWAAGLGLPEHPDKMVA
jgi:hypothetical protein